MYVGVSPSFNLPEIYGENNYWGFQQCLKLDNESATSGDQPHGGGYLVKYGVGE